VTPANKPSYRFASGGHNGLYLVAGFSLGGVFLAGASQTLTAGTIVAFTTLQIRLLFPTVQLLRVSVEVQTSLALFERIFNYLDLRPAIVDEVMIRAPPARGRTPSR